MGELVVTWVDVKAMSSSARSSSTRLQKTGEIRPSESKERWVPRLCTLEGFGEDIHDRSGVDVRGLEPLTRLRVRTHNSLYQLTVLSPGESTVLIQGGRFFAEPVEASLGGSSYGGCMLKTRWIGLGMRMEIHGQDSHIVTSPVRSVQAEDDSSLPGPF